MRSLFQNKFVFYFVIAMLTNYGLIIFGVILRREFQANKFTVP